MTATSSASATGCRLISNSISSVAAKKQPESVFACVCVCVKERKRFMKTKLERERNSYNSR